MQIAPFFFGLLGCVALFWALKGLIAFRRASYINSATALVFATVTLPSAATAFAVLTGTRAVTADLFFNRLVVLSGPALGVVAIASPLLLIIATVILLTRLPGRPRLNLAAPVAAMVTTLMTLRHEQAVSVGSVAVNVVVLLASGFVLSGRGAVLGAALGVVMMIFLSGLAAILVPQSSFLQCSAGCGPGNFLFAGVADNKNALGLVLTMGIPFLWFGLPHRPRATAVLAAVMVLGGGSGTSSIAAVTELALLWLCARDADVLATDKRLLARWASAVAALVMITVPFLRLSDHALSERPPLWRLALAKISESPLTGHGAGSWRSLVEDRIIPRAAGYSTHNQFIDVLYVGGILGLVGVLVMVAVTIRQVGSRIGTLAAFAFPMLICGTTERPWSFGQIDWLAWTLPAFLLAVPLRDLKPMTTTSLEGSEDEEVLKATALPAEHAGAYLTAT